jgi:hypothetical protein
MEWKWNFVSGPGRPHHEQRNLAPVLNRGKTELVVVALRFKRSSFQGHSGHVI